MKPTSAADNVRKAVGIWIRVSTEDQAQGESPKTHEMRARSYAELKGWEVVDLYDLAGVSGKSVREHPEAQRMLKDVRSGRITGLIFSKLARLARNTKELLEFADIFRDCEADLVSIGENIDTSTPVGRLFYTMIGALAQWEREEIGSRVKAACETRAKAGKSIGGRTVYGYRWDGEGRFVPDPAEVPVRKLIYELFIEERRFKTVAAILNGRGYRTRGGELWSDITVKNLIRDTTAKGSKPVLFTTAKKGQKNGLRPKEDWHWLKVEPIVSDETWERANAILEERLQNHLPRAKRPVHLFAGVLACHCGAKMYVPTKSKKHVCFGRGCHNKIPIEDLEAVYREKLRGHFIDPEKVARLLASSSEVLGERQRLLDSKRGERDRTRDEMNDVLALFREGQVKRGTFATLFAPLEERLGQINDALPKLQAEVDILQVEQLSVDAIVQEAATLYDIWPKMTAPEKRQIVEAMTERIVVGEGEIEITLTDSPSYKEATKWQSKAILYQP